MEPGTRLLVIDAVLPSDGTPRPAVALDIVMLMVLKGRERTAGLHAHTPGRSPDPSGRPKVPWGRERRHGESRLPTSPLPSAGWGP